MWRTPCPLALSPTLSTPSTQQTLCRPLPALQVVVAFSFRSDDLFTFNHVEGVEL